MTHVVIIGASHAAAEVIATFKKKGFDGRITLIGEEAYLPYQRPPLSKKYFNGELPIDKLYIRNPQSYDDFGVEQLLSTRVDSIDRPNKQVKLDNGESIGYDKLIVATGTRARKLQIDGSSQNKIKYLRSISDVDAIQKSVQSGSSLLIVGAGYIGLELAASARQLGVKVTVLEAMDRVLQRVTSPNVSEFYQGIHREAGVDIRLNAMLESFPSDGVAQLSSGETLEFDCAVVGIGVLPNVELAQEAGLSCDNGVVVDEFCRTSDEDIYAVGDCSNHPSFIYDRRLRLESVPNAMGQAKTAALHIIGEPQKYDEVPWFWSDQYDIKLQTVGLLEGYDQIIERGDRAEKKFSVFYLKQGRLLAVDAINSPADFMLAKKAVAAKVTPDLALLDDNLIPIKTILA